MDNKWQTTLFLAAPYNPQLVDARLLQVFPYLDQMMVEQEAFLGKKIEEPVSLEKLQQYQAHVTSLFKRLLPHQPPPELKLFALTC